MRRPLLTGVLGLALLGCGGGDDRAGGFVGSLPFELGVSAALADEVEEFQISVMSAQLSTGGRVDCEVVKQTCMSAAFADAVFELRTEAGRTVKAHLYAANLAGGTASQEVAVTGVPVGRDYVMVVEAIAGSTLLGSSCTFLAAVQTGRNDRVVLNPITPLTPAPACDPHF